MPVNKEYPDFTHCSVICDAGAGTANHILFSHLAPFCAQPERDPGGDGRKQLAPFSCYDSSSNVSSLVDSSLF